MDGLPLQPLGAVTRCLRDKLGVLRGHVTTQRNWAGSASCQTVRPYTVYARITLPVHRTRTRINVASKAQETKCNINERMRVRHLTESSKYEKVLLVDS